MGGLTRTDSNARATRMAFVRDTKKGKNVTLNLEHLVEAGRAEHICIQFPDAPEENPEDDMLKYKRWWIHFRPTEAVAGPFKGATIRVEFSLRKRDGCDNWPNTPPAMKVLDPIWHPNVRMSDGLSATRSRTPRAVLAPTEFLPRDILFKTSSRVSLSSSLRMASRQERMIPSTLTLRHRSRTITMPTAPKPSTCRLKRATPGIAPTRS